MTVPISHCDRCRPINNRDRQRMPRIRRLVFLVTAIAFFTAVQARGFSAFGETSTGIRLQGPGTAPQLGFACCEHDIEEDRTLFADPSLIRSLLVLHASIAIALPDFSAKRMDIVRRLNREGIPVVAWILLSKEQGVYMNAANTREASARVAEFEAWTRSEGLHWDAVGLDIEPDFAMIERLRGHPLRAIGTVLKRSANGAALARANSEYAGLVDRIRADGYGVETYEMPYVPLERDVHSSLLDRVLGTANVRTGEDYLMLYTTFARPVGAAMIWVLGKNAQGIAVGSTDGNAAPGSAGGPLSWDEFERDLIVASHFTHQVGVYDLEGCVRQGFMPRLMAMNWNESVVIPADAVRRATRVHLMACCVLWTASNLEWLAALCLICLALAIWRRRNRRKRAAVTAA